MTYNPGIPLASNNPLSDVPGMQTNFELANTYFGTDHVPFTEAANQGQHQQVTFPAPLASDPSTSGTTSVVYPKSISGNEQLFYKNASGTVTQLTPVTSSVPKVAGAFKKTGTTYAKAGTLIGITSVSRQISSDGQIYAQISLSVPLKDSDYITFSIQSGQTINNPPLLATMGIPTPNQVNLIFWGVDGKSTDLYLHQFFLIAWNGNP